MFLETEIYLREILDTDVWSLAPEFEIITIEFCIYIL